jgi:ATP-dependent RNA helicase DBP3
LGRFLESIHKKMKSNPKAKQEQQVPPKTTEIKVSKPKKFKNKTQTQKKPKIVEIQKEKQDLIELDEIIEEIIVEKTKKTKIDKSQTTFSKEEIEEFLKENKATVSGSKNYTPMLTFASAKFTKDINENLSTFEYPTPIQSLSWPIIFDNHNIVSIAKTGSGKSLAFIIPAIMHVRKLKVTSTGGPIVSQTSFNFFRFWFCHQQENWLNKFTQSANNFQGD